MIPSLPTAGSLPLEVPPPADVPVAAVVCSRCGGSGVLRHGDHRFRTCLDCLGQGRLPVFRSEPSLADRIRPQAAA